MEYAEPQKYAKCHFALQYRCLRLSQTSLDSTVKQNLNQQQLRGSPQIQRLSP